jgi:hypothetical protein
MAIPKDKDELKKAIINNHRKLTTEQSNISINLTEKKELYETTWYDKWTLGIMIQLNTFSPFKNAHDRIRIWKKTKQLN